MHTSQTNATQPTVNAHPTLQPKLHLAKRNKEQKHSTLTFVNGARVTPNSRPFPLSPGSAALNVATPTPTPGTVRHLAAYHALHPGAVRRHTHSARGCTRHALSGQDLDQCVNAYDCSLFVLRHNGPWRKRTVSV